MSLSQQVGRDRPGWLLRPVGHQLPPVPQCPPGLDERGTGDHDGRAVGMAEHQHPDSQRIGSFCGGCDRGAWATLARGCSADLAHVDPYPVDAVLLVGAAREHVHVGKSARCLTRIVSTDGGGRVDAEYGHDPVERLNLLLRQVRCGEHRQGLQAVQLSGAREYVAEQQHAQVHRADPVVDDR